VMFSAIANPAEQAPRTMKNAMVFRREAIAIVSPGFGRRLKRWKANKRPKGILPFGPIYRTLKR
jgi:hypothetical protein